MQGHETSLHMRFDVHGVKRLHQRVDKDPYQDYPRQNSTYRPAVQYCQDFMALKYPNFAWSHSTSQEKAECFYLTIGARIRTVTRKAPSFTAQSNS